MRGRHGAEFDYVIVGAGSAGCVLASRLSEDPDVQVALVEAGPEDFSVLLRMPAALSMPLASTRFNWGYHSEPEAGLDGRRLYCPRGRVVGGSSSINGMVWVRGHADDFDRWHAEGAAGWDHAAVLPYFRRIETWTGGADRWRGASGPMHVQPGRADNPLDRAFLAAGESSRWGRSEDINGWRQEGLAPMQMTVHRGQRWSSARGWLDGARQRPNLHLLTRTRVLGLDVEGARVDAVRLRVGSGEQRLRARREVLLCAGAIGSPQLLMLSGIGDPDHLAGLGVPVRVALSDVGRHLQDHLEVYVQYAARQPVSLYPLLKPWNKLGVGLRWLLDRGGPGASSHFETGGFVRAMDDARTPDVQFHFLPLAIRYDGSLARAGHGFQLHAGPMHPTSRGTVTLASADPLQAPRIHFDYASTQRDRLELRAAVRLARELVAERCFDGLRGAELAPGPAVTSDAELDAWIRREVESAYHPVGTCRMGPAGEAVVAPDCRVHGVDNLRVVDASVMPSLTTGNTNAPTIMLADRVADLIRGRAPLAPQAVPRWPEPMEA